MHAWMKALFQNISDCIQKITSSNAENLATWSGGASIRAGCIDESKEVVAGSLPQAEISNWIATHVLTNKLLKR